MALIFVGATTGQFETWKRPFVAVHYKGSKSFLLQQNPPHGNWLPTPLKAKQRHLRELDGLPPLNHIQQKQQIDKGMNWL